MLAEPDQVAVEVDVDCRICLDSLQPPTACLQCCREDFHRDCLQRHFTSLIMERKVRNLRCPNPECSTEASDDSIRALVSNEVWQKLEYFRVDIEVAQDENKSWCPNRQCATVVERPNQGDAVCPTCQMSFCWDCRLPSHPDATCEEARARQPEGQLEIDIQEGDQYKKCPACGVLVERDEGCAQMKCANCRAMFCWHCLERVEGDFWAMHWTSGRCAGMLGHSAAQIYWFRAQTVCMMCCLLFVVLPLVLVACILMIPFRCFCGAAFDRYVQEHVAPAFEQPPSLQDRRAQIVADEQVRDPAQQRASHPNDEGENLQYVTLDAPHNEV